MLFRHPALHHDEQILRIARALADSVSLQEMSTLVAAECKQALAADAICVYLLQPDDHFEMMAEIGCTDEFRTQWRRVPKSMVPLPDLKHNPDGIFYGKAKDLKTEIPESCGLVDRSKRDTVAYAPLALKNRLIGLLGYSYNQPKPLTDKAFLLTLVQLCAQALERARLTELEKKAQAEAKAANAAKTSFLANISHEIRTPLGVIQGFADMIAESQLPGPAKEWAEIIQKNSVQLSSIIGDVLDIAKIEADKIEVENVTFSLADVLDEVVGTARFKVMSRPDVKLEFIWSDDLPKVIQSDPTRIKQILNNVIGNAIKFTVRGTVTVKVAFGEQQCLECWVQDSGTGIGSDQQARIFEPFLQASPSTSREFGGSGLGLAISRRLARALGGELQLVSSVPGQGSEFKLRIPCQGTDLAVVRSRVHNLPNDLKGIRVLVVEDNPDNQYLLGRLLRGAGAKVDIAPNGELGVRMALQQSYDVILMDIQLPGLDGFEAVSRLRFHGYKKGIAALTAHALQSERERSVAIGFDDYLTKPVDHPSLLNTIRRLGHKDFVH